MRKIIIFMILYTAALILPAGAAEEYMGDLGTVLITPTKSSKAAVLIPANISVISAEDIENSPSKTITDLLRNESGISVQDFYGTGNTVRVDMLGFGDSSASNVLVMVDGRRMDSADLGGTNWQQISAETIERIEIIKGAGSVLYGDNSSSGVINIITKSPKGRFYTEASVWNGSYESLGGKADISGSLGRLSCRLDSSVSASEGYRDNGFSDSRDVYTRMDYEASETVGLILAGGYRWNSYGLPGDILATDLDAGVNRDDVVASEKDNEAAENDSYVQTAISYRPAESIQLELSSSYQQKFVSVDWVSFASVNDRESYRNTSGIKGAWSPDGRYGLTVGFDYDVNRLNSAWRGAFPTYENILVVSHAPYFLAEVSFLDDLMISAGARRQIAEYDFSPQAAWDRKMERTNDSYDLGATLLLGKKGKVYAGLGRSFRFPKTDEFASVITDWTTFATINTELEVQTSFDARAGIVYFPLEWLTGALHYYSSKVTDEIYFDAVSFLNANYDDTLHTVIQMEAKIMPAAYADIKLSYTATSAIFRAGAYDGNDVPGVLSSIISASAGCSIFDSFRVSANMESAGSRYFVNDLANQYAKMHGYTRLDLALKYSMKNMFISFKVNNVCAAKYSEYGAVNGAGVKGYYPAPERNIMCEIGTRY